MPERDNLRTNRPRLAGSSRPAGKHANTYMKFLSVPVSDSSPPVCFSPLRSKGRYAQLCRGSFFSRVLSVPRIHFRLIVSRHNPSRKGEVHASAPLRARTMPGKRTVRRYEDENHTTDGEKNHDDFPAYPDQRP